MIKYNIHIIVFLFLSLLFNACSSNNSGDHIVLELDNQHLKDTPAGFWLNDFDIDYSFESRRFKRQISDIIEDDGELIDGDPKSIIEVIDLWTFSRDSQLKNPNWTLIATRSLD